MSGFTSTPYDWVRQISLDLKEVDEIPLWGKSPEFPWEAYSKLIKDSLKLESCSITPLETNWRESADVISHINEHPFAITFALNPLKGHAYLLFAHSEIEKLLRLLLHATDRTAILEKDFILGFSHFLSLELADAFQKTGYEKAFLPQVLSQGDLPDVPCLCIDIKAIVDDQEFHSMLCISNELRTSIKEYYAKRESTSSPELYNKLEITLQLVAGQTTISRQEWEEITPGDFLILDSCSLEPGAEKSRIMLTLNGLPIFRGKLKDGNIKILEYPQLHEVQTPMSPKDYDDEESDFDEETDSDFDESEEYTEDDDEHSEEYSDDEDLYTDDDEEESEYEEEDEDDEEIETPSRDLKASAAPAKAVAAPPPAKKEAIAQTKEKLVQAKSSPVKPQDIPLTISVEVGRLQMTIQKLTELEPGNLLELDVHPENGVDLIVNGKCIGKGELLRIGDVLGVRILEKV